MEDHQDYLPGETPTAHGPSHEDGGSDQVAIAGLLGTPAALATHALLPTAHQDAPALIGVHALLPSIHHFRYTDIEAKAAADIQIGLHAAVATAHQDAPALIGVHALLPSIHHLRYTDIEAKAAADVQIGIHAAVATAHQDAPNLISTHKGDATAHHAKYTDANAQAAVLPGSMMPWPTEIPPTGWLECDGAAISRTTYADLFAIISVDFGNGDGSTTFNLPDLRARFIRGWDHGAGVDPNVGTRTDRGDGATGDHAGTKQADDFKSHRHFVSYGTTNQPGVISYEGANTFTDPTGPTNYVGGDETRPVNIYFMWCMKY